MHLFGKKGDLFWPLPVGLFWQKVTFGGQSGVRGRSFLAKLGAPSLAKYLKYFGREGAPFWQKRPFLGSVDLFGQKGVFGLFSGVKRPFFGLYSWDLAFFWEKLRLMDSFEFLGAFFS